MHLSKALLIGLIGLLPVSALAKGAQPVAGKTIGRRYAKRLITTSLLKVFKWKSGKLTLDTDKTNAPGSPDTLGFTFEPRDVGNSSSTATLVKGRIRMTKGGRGRGADRLHDFIMPQMLEGRSYRPLGASLEALERADRQE